MRLHRKVFISALFLVFGTLFTSAQTSRDSLPQTDSTLLYAPMIDYDNPKEYIVNEIRVNGIKFLDPQIIAQTSGINKGDTIMVPSDYVSSAIRKMWAQQYYSDVKIIAEPVGDSINFEIFLQERPRVYQWDIQGTNKSQRKELLEKLNLKRGSELSDYTLKNSVDIIKKYYVDKAFRNVEVNIRQENDTTIRNAVNVTFVVAKNKKVKIKHLDFVGNEVYTDRRLRKTMKKTNQKSINILKGSKLKPKEYEDDKENLIDFYNSKGYRNATLIKDSIYQINNKRIGIVLELEEGNKFYYRNISWLGNSIYETAELNEMLGIHPGDHYDRITMNKRLGIGKEMSPDDINVSSLYQNNGYLFSQIEPAEIVVAADSIDLVIKIYEGKQARINDVNITGNLRVDDKVIRRELFVRPGELYDRSMLVQTMRLLAQMEHFNPENMQPGILPITNELVDINFGLEEKASDRFELSGGWGSGMFVGSIGVVLSNFSIKNMFKGDAWRPYPSGQNQQLAIRGQTNGTYYKAVSLSFTEPWVGGRKPNSLTVGLYYSDETNGYNLLSAGDKHFRTMGASVGIGRRLKWPDRNFTLYNEIGYKSYNLKDWNSFIVENGWSNIIQFTTVFGRNSVDQPIFPRSGSDFSISVSLTPPYSLFDNNNYADANLSNNDRYRWIEYHKWQMKGEWFFPLSQNRKFVLMARAQMGYLGHYDKNKPSPFEGFDVGGDGLTGYSVYGVDIISLRGYKSSSLTVSSPGNTYSTVYNKYTVELRFPFILDPSSTVYGLIFAEAGNAFSSWQNFDPFLLKRSIGAGVRFYLPVVGLLGFDYGYGFDRSAGASKKSGSQVHFMIGQQF